jgi:hypothetical protein
MHLDAVQVGGSQPGLLERGRGRQAGHARHLVGRGGPHRRREHRGRGIGGAQLLADQQGRGCAVGDRRAHLQRERPDDLPCCQDLLDRELAAVLRGRVQLAVPVVLDHHPREVRACRPGPLHVPQRGPGVHVHEEGPPGRQVRGRGLDIDRAADGRERADLVGVRHLLGRDGEHGILHTGRDSLPGQVERGRGRGTGVLDVEDREPGQAERPEEELTGQHLLAGDRSGDSIAEVTGLHIPHRLAGVLQRRGDSLSRKVFQGATRLLGKSRHADAGDVYVPHHAAPLPVPALSDGR